MSMMASTPAPPCVDKQVTIYDQRLWVEASLSNRLDVTTQALPRHDRGEDCTSVICTAQDSVVDDHLVEIEENQALDLKGQGLCDLVLVREWHGDPSHRCIIDGVTEPKEGALVNAKVLEKSLRGCHSALE